MRNTNRLISNYMHNPQSLGSKNILILWSKVLLFFSFQKKTVFINQGQLHELHFLVGKVERIASFT